MNSCAVTDVGQIRRTNQDFVYATDDALGVLDNFYMVADGMGGHQGGGFASRYAAERMVELLSAECGGGTVSALNQAITTVNREIHQKAAAFDELRGMGTTLVAAVISENTLYVANVGDSRLYIVSDTIRQITRDHSWVEEMLAQGKITRDSDLFYQNKNVITRAVGVRDFVTADFFEIELRAGDKILMCSDGLSNMLSDPEIAEIMKRETNCQDAALELVRQGNANGGRDNISVIVIDPEIR